MLTMDIVYPSLKHTDVILLLFSKPAMFGTFCLIFLPKYQNMKYYYCKPHLLFFLSNFLSRAVQMNQVSAHKHKNF